VVTGGAAASAAPSQPVSAGRRRVAAIDRDERGLEVTRTELRELGAGQS